MTQPLLLIFATRYDHVTRRTHRIAQELLAKAGQLRVPTVALLEAAATRTEFLKAAANRPTVVAFYSHGDLDGRILAQDKEPCWTIQSVPDLCGSAVFAHACRAIRWLRYQAARHKARLLVGYESDLITPANGSIQFWEIYKRVHSFVPQHLAASADEGWIRSQFYELCTACFHELNTREARLIELVAVQQSRDEIVFV